MKLYPDDGRFEVNGDPQDVVSARYMLWKHTRLWYEHVKPGLSPKDEYWLAGVDERTGARVKIHPRVDTHTWVKDLATEAVARRVQALASPYTVPVLHVGPGVVFAEPPPVRPRPSMGIDVAASCAFQACEVTARLHERGCGSLGFGPSHLRLVEEGGEWQIRWLIPGVADLDLLDALELAKDRVAERNHPRWDWKIDPIQHDLWQLAFFFFSLLAADALRGEDLDPDRGKALRGLTRIRDEGPKAIGFHDAAAMAHLFAVLAGLPATRVEELPSVCALPRLYPDWDEVIAEGEALLGSESRHLVYIRLPLAVAYHQRASRAWARGDLEAALVDVDRALALDDHAPYHTTRAVLLDALLRGAEARAAIAAAFEADARPKTTWNQWEEEDPGENAARARAHLTRGLFALRDGALAQAEADLRRSQALDATPLSARALAAVGRAREKNGAGVGG
ncbi:heme biosynthesis HemY N-terminal domain-containing protein [Polyangium aurulentum]|uniref:heme biosynthesis HemY N-terminal domain-containing protein n=1 Tax=Polyangium aurulentum TaxID=2567896 RepID=UPI0010ADDBDB|nr:heme biosynthesis HemY N-terminal domain-containing protein [Polyangium aurulentum]UQA59369.1 heme biosynthesis HemY N-terminal domain-containing protein [Polyangium aurulentum]